MPVCLRCAGDPRHAIQEAIVSAASLALVKHEADPKVSQYDCAALMNLAEGGDAIKEVIITAGALRPIVTALVKHEANPGF